MKWEYHFYQAGSGRDFEQAEEAMNNLGRAGWELVTTYTPATRACALGPSLHAVP